MDYYCDVHLNYIKCGQFKSNSHQEFDNCKHIILSHEDIDINNVDEAFYLYIIEHNKKFDYYLVKYDFILAFIDYEYSPYVTSKVSDNKTMIHGRIFWKK